MSEISEKTLKIIEEKKVSPLPRWCFCAENYGLWVLFAIVIILGSLAFSTAIFLVFDYDWAAYKYSGTPVTTHYILAVPIFWVLLLLLLSVLAYENFKFTKKGYSIEIYKIFAISFILCLFFGVLFFFAGFGSKLNNFLLRSVPAYHSCVCTKEDVWNAPDKGLLAGRITEIKSEREFLLQDFHAKLWSVVLSGAAWSGDFYPREGLEIKITGRREPGENIFYAEEIMPW